MKTIAWGELVIRAGSTVRMKDGATVQVARLVDNGYGDAFASFSGTVFYITDVAAVVTF